MKLIRSFSQIYAWEIMNEPEWIISDLPQPVRYALLRNAILSLLILTPSFQSVNSGTSPVNLADFYAFASAIASAVHTHTNAKVTLGTRRAFALSLTSILSYDRATFL